MSATLPPPEVLKEWVRGQVGPKRFAHIEGVVERSLLLAKRHGLPSAPAEAAAWLHDCGKELPREGMRRWLQGVKMDRLERALPGLWHPHVGAAIARKRWGIRDAAVLEAIRCHTLGRAGMGPLAQLLFCADFTERGRNFRGVAKARRTSWESLRRGVLSKASMTIGHLLDKGMTIHPRLLETWNHFNRENHGNHR